MSDFKPEDVFIRQVNSFQFEVIVKTKSSDDFSFRRNFFLSTACRAITPTLTKEGLLCIECSHVMTEYEGKLTISRPTSQEHKHYLMNTIPYNDCRIDSEAVFRYNTKHNSYNVDDTHYKNWSSESVSSLPTFKSDHGINHSILKPIYYIFKDRVNRMVYGYTSIDSNSGYDVYRKELGSSDKYHWELYKKIQSSYPRQMNEAYCHRQSAGLFQVSTYLYRKNYFPFKMIEF